MQTDARRRIARRLRGRREQLGRTQEELAQAAGLRHRQTVTAIEAEDRSVSATELASLARALDVGVAYFTDRFVATGEAAFSFRAESAPDEDVADFEDRAGRWVATYRELEERRGARPSLLLPALSLSPDSRYEDAAEAAEDVRERLDLGPYPAEELETALERDWRIPVLYFEGRPRISGAASRLGGLQVIFINRDESRGRRNFDLAHELFHLLTWDSMPPRRIDDSRPSTAAKRVERLADNFASSLLMPEASVQQAWECRPDGQLEEWIEEWIAATAVRFRVSAPALKWRLYNLDRIGREDVPTDEVLRAASGNVGSADATPPLFNATFVERVHTAVESGFLSLRKASAILGLDTVEFAELCRSYGRPLSYET